MAGRTYQVKRRQRKRNKKREEEGGEEDRMKTERKETGKKVGIKYLDKRKYCVGTEPKCIHSLFYYHWSWWLSG